MSFLNRLTNPASDEAIAEIAALKNQIADIEAGHNAALSAMKAQLDQAEEALEEAATLKDDKEAAEKKLAETEAEKTALEGDNAELETKLAEAKAATAQAAVELAASAGLANPLNIEGGSSIPETKTMTREAFTNLKPFEAMKFIKSGGKLTD